MPREEVVDLKQPHELKKTETSRNKKSQASYICTTDKKLSVLAQFIPAVLAEHSPNYCAARKHLVHRQAGPLAPIW